MLKKHKNPANKKTRSKHNFPGKLEWKTVEKSAEMSYYIFKDIVSKKQYMALHSKTLELYNSLVKHRGVLEGTKRFKAIRTYALKHILGLKPEPVKCLSLNKQGFPRDIMHLKMYYKPKNHEMLKMVNTIMNISRLSLISLRMDISTISSIYKGINKTADYYKVVQEFDSWLPEYLTKLGIEVNQDPIKLGEKLEFLNIQSYGPNSKEIGKDALTCAPFDAVAIINDRNVSKSIKAVLVDHYKREAFWEYILEIGTAAKQNLPEGVSENVLKHSKIICTPTPENKQRVVAMVDYFTQVTLAPLRQALDNAERKVPNSYMFDQDKGRKLASEFTRDSSPVSLDGSDFTDRFPLEVQGCVLKHMFSETFSQDIRKLMTNRAFKVQNVNRPIFYSIGQPMGMNCSFQLANISHALFAIWCSTYTQREEDPTAISAVVGDDIVFKYENDAQIYKTKMTFLGMKFSEFKGFESTSEIRIAEFCKHLYLNATQINGLSPRPFLNLARDYKHIISVIKHSQLNELSATPYVIFAIPKKYRDSAFDLLVLTKLFTLGIDALYSPLLPYCSNVVKNLKDDLLEIKSSFRQNAAIKQLIVTTLMYVRNEENKKAKEIVEDLPMDYSIRTDRKVISPLKTESVSLPGTVADFSRSKLGEFLTFLGISNPDTLDIVRKVPTPLTFFLGNSKMGSRSPLEKNFNFRMSLEEKIIYLNDPILWEQLINEIKTSLYTGHITLLANTITRMDDKGSEELDKRMFLLTKRMRRILSEQDLIYQYLDR